MNGVTLSMNGVHLDGSSDLEDESDNEVGLEAAHPANGKQTLSPKTFLTDIQVAQRRRRRRPRRKVLVATPAADLSLILLLGSKKTAVQSEPPRVGLSKIFKGGVFPIGEEVEYVDR